MKDIFSALFQLLAYITRTTFHLLLSVSSDQENRSNGVQVRALHRVEWIGESRLLIANSFCL